MSLSARPCGVADPGALHLGIHHNLLGHFQIRLLVHINMANAFVMFDHRNFGIRRHGANQILAAARNDEIDAVVELEEGVRMVGELLDAEPEDVKIGAPVEVAWVHVDDDLTIPAWRLA